MAEATTPGQPEVQAMTESEGAEALLARWGANDDAPEQEEESEAQADDQPQGDDQEQEAEQSEGDDDDSDAQSEEIEIDVAGEKFKIPAPLAEQAKRIEAKAKEVEAGATRKFQEAADLRKFAESQLESVKKQQQVATQQADLIADHRAIMRRMEAISQIDLNQMAEQDPVALTKLNAEYMQLQNAKQRVEAAYQQAEAKMQEETQAHVAQRMTRLQDFATKNISGWNDQYSNTLLDFAVKQLGADPNALRSIMDESILKGIDYAYKGWKMSQADPKAKQVVQTKTLKPGASGQMQSNAKQNADKAMKQLKSNKNVDSAVAALLARSNLKKRK